MYFKMRGHTRLPQKSELEEEAPLLLCLALRHAAVITPVSHHITTSP